MHIRKNDTVVLLKAVTGHPDREKGYRGRVLRVMRREGKIIVEGVAYRYKHVRPSRDNPSGGRITKEALIDISDVMLYCPKCDRGAKSRRERGPDGKIQRLCKRCGSPIPLPGRQ